MFGMMMGREVAVGSESEEELTRFRLKRAQAGFGAPETAQECSSMRDIIQLKTTSR